jgi:hypothetical protein
MKLMSKLMGSLLFLAGAWMLIAPQANIGLAELRWLSNSIFPGEPLIGMVSLGVAYYLLTPPRP